VKLTIEDLKAVQGRLAARECPRLTEPLTPEDLCKAQELIFAPDIKAETKRRKELREAIAFARLYTGRSRAPRRASRRGSAGLPWHP
jgi:hypothetical protein